MRSLLLGFTALFAAAALAAPCATDSPVRLKGKYPIRDAIRLTAVRFDRAPQFANGSRPLKAPLELALFDVRVNDRKQMRLGATVFAAGPSEQIGFATNYVGDDVEFVGACGVDELGNVVYANRREERISSGAHAGTAVTEVAASVDGHGNLAMLRLTSPVFRGAEWTGEQQTLCLKSGTLTQPSPDDEEDGLH